MRILVVSNLYPPFVIGGYEINCSNVVKALRQRGHDVTVATTPNHFPGEADPPYVRRCLHQSAFVPRFEPLDGQIRSYAADTSNLDNVIALRRLIRKAPPDVVFLWNLNGLGGLHLIDFLNTHGIPWAIYLGDCVFAQLVNSAPNHVKAVFRGHDSAYFAQGEVLSVSQQLVEECENLGNFTFPLPPTIVHGYAVTSGPLLPRSYRRDGRLNVMSSGRVSEHKGTKLICDAVALLVKDGAAGFHVDIYGDGEVSYYVNYVHSLGVSDRVTFHGHVSQPCLQEALRAHDLFLFPTWSREPLGFAPFEAAAQGCVPVITADCGCAERIVGDVHGIKIDRTAEAVARAVRRAISGGIDLERIGAAAANMVREDLSLDGHVDKILAALNRQARAWDLTSIDDPRAELLTFVKHHLSTALLFGATD
jgi:glycogen synthase